jgi:hypothetical protein
MIPKADVKPEEGMTACAMVTGNWDMLYHFLHGYVELMSWQHDAAEDIR